LSIGLENAMPVVLAQALKDAGFNLYEEGDSRIRGVDGYSSVVWNKGKGLVITAQNVTATKAVIMQAYSRASVSWASQRAGFKQTSAWRQEVTQ
jgi:hypothetical protein